MAQTGTAGSYGTFAIDAAGAWTYTAELGPRRVRRRHHLHRHLRRCAAPTAPTPRSPSTSSAPTTRRCCRPTPANLTETNAAADIIDLRHADHQRRRQPGDLRGAGRHRRQLRHLRDRRRRRLDLHRQLGPQRVRRRHHLHRHLRGGERRRHRRPRSPSTSSAPTTRRCCRPTPANLTETNAAADITTSGTLTISDVDSAGDLRGAGRHRRQLRHLRDRRRRRLDLHRRARPTTSSSPAPPTPTPSRCAAPTAPLTSVTVNILGTNDAAVLSADTSEPDRDQRGGRHLDLRHADHQRRRQPGDLRGAGRHRRQLRHLRDRRRRRLDLHRQLGPRRVRRRHHLHRHLRGAQRRRHR